MNVSIGSLADIYKLKSGVSFTPESEHSRRCFEESAKCQKQSFIEYLHHSNLAHCDAYLGAVRRIKSSHAQLTIVTAKWYIAMLVEEPSAASGTVNYSEYEQTSDQAQIIKSRLSDGYGGETIPMTMRIG